MLLGQVFSKDAKMALKRMGVSTTGGKWGNCPHQDFDL